MTDILRQPVRVDRSAERVYFFDGLACADVIGPDGTRTAVLNLVAQAQEMARALLPLANTQCEGSADCGGHRGGLCPPCRARAVLRAAGVSEGPVHSRGCAELCDFEPCRKSGRCEG